MNIEPSEIFKVLSVETRVKIMCTLLLTSPLDLEYPFHLVTPLFNFFKRREL